MSEQVPSIGRIVHYTLSADDASAINRRRTTGASIAKRLAADWRTDAAGADQGDGIVGWPIGAQAHIGNEAKEGDVRPMLIVQVWGDAPSSAVNGQVFLDGNDVFWATSRSVGTMPGSFAWPVVAGPEIIPSTGPDAV